MLRATLISAFRSLLNLELNGSLVVNSEMMLLLLFLLLLLFPLLLLLLLLKVGTLAERRIAPWKAADRRFFYLIKKGIVIILITILF